MRAANHKTYCTQLAANVRPSEFQTNAHTAVYQEHKNSIKANMTVYKEQSSKSNTAVYQEHRNTVKANMTVCKEQSIKSNTSWI